MEDDLGLSNGIKLVFQKEMHEFIQVHTYKDAEAAIKTKQYDLILMDIGLPDGSGLDLCRQIRRTKSVPIIFLTANDTEIDEVAGFEAGANDYITKPFSIAILRARIEAVLRKNSSGNVGEEEPILVVEDMTFHFDNFMIVKGKEEIILSKTEQRLLKFLALNPGRVWERESLIQKLWGNEGEFVDENALSVTVKRLRDKIEEDPAKPRHIKTVYGIGYQWEN